MPSAPPQPITQNGAAVDLTPRYARTTTVAASPSGSTETIVASLTLSSSVVIGLGVELLGFVNFTVGTSGVSTQVRIRQTGTSGAIVADSGAVTAVAANLGTVTVAGLDTAAVIPGQVYVLTLTVASGGAASTVSSAFLRGLIL